MGTNEEGIHGYLFSFKARFEDAVKEVGYIQFEGIEDYTEVALGTTVELMSNYHGEVPEGKVFAGWKIGDQEYARGAEFTFSKENGVDMGTNEEGIHGYLFSFKARFSDVEIPQTEAPQTEAPQTEAPQTEAPETDETEQETEDEQEEKPTGSKEDSTNNDSTGKNNGGQKDGAVQTGDDTMIMPYVISLLAAFAVFAVILLKRRKSVR